MNFRPLKPYYVQPLEINDYARRLLISDVKGTLLQQVSISQLAQPATNRYACLEEELRKDIPDGNFNLIQILEGVVW